MAYKEIDESSITLIDSVSSFIEMIRQVKETKEAQDGTSTELYFRGQETEFWDIEPSIFRDDMLSIEHKLMQIPLQKSPTEFRDLNSMFDIMTKYQHYGMCTRLLDLTTNPLVALYFACKKHGAVKYVTEDGEVEKYKLVTSIRGNSMENRVSIESPIGKALRGHRVGDRVEVKVNDDYSYYLVIKSIDKTGSEDEEIRGF